MEDGINFASSIPDHDFNHLHAIFLGNIDIYLYLMSFIHIYLTQVAEIRPQARQWTTYST